MYDKAHLYQFIYQQHAASYNTYFDYIYTCDIRVTQYALMYIIYNMYLYVLYSKYTYIIYVCIIYSKQENDKQEIQDSVFREVTQ